jgi:hypothetical protein
MKNLKNRHIFRFYEHLQPFFDYSISLEKDIPGHNALLISANPGDEALGCAGTLINHVENGGKLEVLYCYQTNTDDVKKAEKTALMLGSKVNHFMPFDKNKLDSGSKFAETLAKLINKTKPEVIFVPFMMEVEAESRIISKTLLKIKNQIELDFMVLAYSVWMPMMPNRIFDISQTWNKKKKILDYCAQLQDEKNAKDYAKIAEGIGQYWGQIYDSSIDYAEAFFMSTIEKYISLTKKVL